MDKLGEMMKTREVQDNNANEDEDIIQKLSEFLNSTKNACTPLKL